MSNSYVTNEQVYGAVKEFIAQRGHSPSLREIAKMVGLKTASTVRVHLVSLRDEKLVTWNEGEPRTLRITADWPSKSGASAA